VIGREYRGRRGMGIRGKLMEKKKGVGERGRDGRL